MGFCDDLALSAMGEDEAQALYNQSKQALTTLKLRINVDKTEVIGFLKRK